MRKLIGIVVLSVLFYSGFSNAAVVVMDFKFFDVDFTALGSPVTSDVVFRVSYDSAAPDVNSGPNVGFYDANVTLRSGAQAAGPVRTRVKRHRRCQRKRQVSAPNHELHGPVSFISRRSDREVQFHSRNERGRYVFQPSLAGHT